MPGDRFPFAVLIGGKQEFTGAGERLFQFADFAALVRGNHVDGGEVTVDVHPEFRPGFVAVLLRHLRFALRQVANVTHRCLHPVARAEVTLDRLRFCW